MGIETLVEFAALQYEQLPAEEKQRQLDLCSYLREVQQAHPNTWMQREKETYNAHYVYCAHHMAELVIPARKKIEEQKDIHKYYEQIKREQ